MDAITINPGEVIDGKYEILSKLGHGGTSVVYKARSLNLNREVAIKMLVRLDDETFKSFSLEAENLAKLDHPAVARVDYFGSSDKWGPYLVMAYVVGCDLGDMVKSQLSIQEAVDLTLAISSGVAACHTREIIHGNLKPSNIRVTTSTDWQERAKIVGFGRAPGVHGYIAPEFLRGKKPTEQCDQYAIACLLYLLLTGHAPFRDLEGDDLVRAIVNGNYMDLALIRPDIPGDLRAAVARGLHPDPTQRYSSIGVFAQAIVQFATPSLQENWTRYFANTQRPVNRRLIDSVSAPRPGGLPERRASFPVIVQTMSMPAPAPRPSAASEPPVHNESPVHSKPRVHSKPPVHSEPAVHSEPPVHSKPRVHSAPAVRSSLSTSRSVSRDSRWLSPNSVFMFSFGAAFGAALATVLFVSYFIYRQHADAEPLIRPPVFQANHDAR
jgi:serine/threonine-protein kinase